MAEVKWDDEQPAPLNSTPAPQVQWDQPAQPPRGVLGAAKDFITAPIGQSGLPNIPRAPMGLAIPGGAAIGPLRGAASHVIGKYGPKLAGQVGLQGATAGAEALMEGKGPLDAAKDAGLGAAASGVLGGAGKLAGKAATGLGGLGSYSKNVSDKLAAKLKELSPTMSGTLDDMIYSQGGHNAAHSAYEKSLGEVVKKGTGKTIQISREAAEALGLQGGGDDAAKIAQLLGARKGQSINLPGVPQGASPGNVLVDAAQAAKAMTGNSGTAAYRAIANALDEANIGDPAARKAYKAYSGLKEYLNAQGGMPGAKLDLVKMQEGLFGKNADKLLKRQLGDFIDILKPPGGKLLEKGDLGLLGGIVGGLGSGAGGGALGGAGGGLLGGTGGIWAGAHLGKKIPYTKGLPTTALNNFLAQLGIRTGGTVPKAGAE